VNFEEREKNDGTSPPKTLPLSWRCRGVAKAQAHPTKPVHFIVPYPPGGQIDPIARLIGQWLQERMGQPFVIENRPGAAANIGTEAVLRAPADGYTLLLASGPNTVNTTLFDKLSFDFIRETAAVASINRIPLVLEAQAWRTRQAGAIHAPPV
jgi:tripartite-type tricarboxylate transporter receptor subunit TctC